MIKRNTELTPGKGKEGENCNVTACQEPESAFYYNKVMHAYYCEHCARDIERFAQMDGLSLFDNLNEDIKKNQKKRREELRKQLTSGDE